MKKYIVLSTLKISVPQDYKNYGLCICFLTCIAVKICEGIPFASSFAKWFSLELLSYCLVVHKKLLSVGLVSRGWSSLLLLHTK